MSRLFPIFGAMLLVIIGAIAMLALPHARYRKSGKVVLNDLKVTPGKVRTTSKEEVCTEKTPQFRNTTESMKKLACTLYGVKECPKEGALEIDHLVSLELGGADDITNLWPQPAEPRPGFHEKDLVENWLHKQVCEGKMPLEKAQGMIAHNWLTAYELMQLDKSSELPAGTSGAQ
jgi:hypothetical protein